MTIVRSVTTEDTKVLFVTSSRSSGDGLAGSFVRAVLGGSFKGR